jgi:hypothetical protein
MMRWGARAWWTLGLALGLPDVLAGYDEAEPDDAVPCVYLVDSDPVREYVAAHLPSAHWEG